MVENIFENVVQIGKQKQKQNSSWDVYVPRHRNKRDKFLISAIWAH